MHDIQITLLATSGVTILGVATGLQPELLISGAAGGWWAISYQPPLKAFTRVNRIFLSSLVAAWLTPLFLFLFSQYITELPGALNIPVALLIGLSTIDILGVGFTKLISEVFTKLLSIIGRVQEKK